MGSSFLEIYSVATKNKLSRIFLVDSEMFYTLRVVDILFYLDLYKNLTQGVGNVTLKKRNY